MQSSLRENEDLQQTDQYTVLLNTQDANIATGFGQSWAPHHTDNVLQYESSLGPILQHGELDDSDHSRRDPGMNHTHVVQPMHSYYTSESHSENPAQSLYNGLMVTPCGCHGLLQIFAHKFVDDLRQRHCDLSVEHWYPSIFDMLTAASGDPVRLFHVINDISILISKTHQQLHSSDEHISSNKVHNNYTQHSSNNATVEPRMVSAKRPRSVTTYEDSLDHHDENYNGCVPSTKRPLIQPIENTTTLDHQQTQQDAPSLLLQEPVYVGTNPLRVTTPPPSVVVDPTPEESIKHQNQIQLLRIMCHSIHTYFQNCTHPTTGMGTTTCGLYIMPMYTTWSSFETQHERIRYIWRQVIHSVANHWNIVTRVRRSSVSGNLVPKKIRSKPNKPQNSSDPDISSPSVTEAQSIQYWMYFVRLWGLYIACTTSLLSETSTCNKDQIIKTDDSKFNSYIEDIANAIGIYNINDKIESDEVALQKSLDGVIDLLVETLQNITTNHKHEMEHEMYDTLRYTLNIVKNRHIQQQINKGMPYIKWATQWPNIIPLVVLHKLGQTTVPHKHAGEFSQLITTQLGITVNRYVSYDDYFSSTSQSSMIQDDQVVHKLQKPKAKPKSRIKKSGNTVSVLECDKQRRWYDIFIPNSFADALSNYVNKRPQNTVVSKHQSFVYTLFRTAYDLTSNETHQKCHQSKIITAFLERMTLLSK